MLPAIWVFCFSKIVSAKGKRTFKDFASHDGKTGSFADIYARKTADLLPVLLVGICFLLLLYGKEKTESVVQNGYELRRGQYLEDPREVALVISNGREEKKIWSMRCKADNLPNRNLPKNGSS